MREATFERLYAEHAAPVFNFFLYRTGNRGVAEDLTADTFERVLRTRRPFDPRRGSETGWLYSIALNRLRDHLRRREVESRSLMHAGQEIEAYEFDRRGQAGERELEAVETRQTVLDALEVLSYEEREAVALRYGADLTLAEAARVLGEPRTTIEGRVYRSLSKLRAELG
jgi:RNA polymerase sigma-70 factor, ECF subfamily